MPKKSKRTKEVRKAEKKYLTRYTLTRMVDEGMVPEEELNTIDRILKKKRKLNNMGKHVGGIRG